MCRQWGRSVCAARVRRDTFLLRIPRPRFAAAGFGQLELMLALTLGSGLCLVAAQYYQHAVSMSRVHEYLQLRAERIMVLQQSVGSALQRMLWQAPLCLAYSDDELGAPGVIQPPTGTHVACPDWLHQESELAARVVSATDTYISASLEPDGDMLSIAEARREAPGLTDYFTARHTASGRYALYRRRARDEGGHHPAEELVTGWSSFQVSACYRQGVGSLSAWQCIPASELSDLSATAGDGRVGLIRVCAVHETPVAAVSQVLAGVLDAPLEPQTCLAWQRWLS